MTTEKKPHKHADVLRAIADGITVQFREYRNYTWIDRQDDPDAVDPITHDFYEWRIKPEVKPDQVYFMSLGNPSTCNDVTTIEGLARNYFDKSIDSLKLTFDGETGKLKSAEVI